MSNFFKTKDDAVNYVYQKLGDPTPIKLQKALYFVWAFYAATYGNIDNDKSENQNSKTNYPKYLFDADFEAWQYGPVDCDVWAKNSRNEIKGTDSEFKDLVTIGLDNVVTDIKSFIDNIINQVKKVNDFGLVNRSHLDKAWKEVFDPNQKHVKMDNEEIKKDYIEYVEQQEKQQYGG